MNINKDWIEQHCQFMGYVIVDRNNQYPIGAVYRKVNEDRPNTWYYIGLDIDNQQCVKTICNYGSYHAN